ncbi:hypothetical protein HPB47_002381 [Ixodes persulcatus]|uniref:Uncharacterized protein n=1 Tax=Ixodes persulcatus TaxID=34615 RepID=A0AC60PLE7_IXOPE|nr:hypothetical protein HPB47_002381 [Ixodes persulcatus]
MGTWEAIKMDTVLGLTDKILPDGEQLTPHTKHLQSRTDNLLKMLPNVPLRQVALKKGKKKLKRGRKTRPKKVHFSKAIVDNDNINGSDNASSTKPQAQGEGGGRDSPERPRGGDQRSRQGSSPKRTERPRSEARRGGAAQGQAEKGQLHKRSLTLWKTKPSQLFGGRQDAENLLTDIHLKGGGMQYLRQHLVSVIYCRRHKGLRSSQSQAALAKAQVRATICIVFLLGLTWIFAYLSLLEEVSRSWGRLFEYLFVASSSLQGFVIFLFHVAYEKTAREFWLGNLVYKVLPTSRKRSFDQTMSKNTLSSTGQKTTST